MISTTPLDRFLLQHAEIAGEVFRLSTDDDPQFAPEYHHYPEALAGLVKTMARLILALKRFQRMQAEGVQQRVNLNIPLDQLDDFNLFIDFAWAQDTQDMVGIFTSLLPEAIAAGGLMSQLETGITIDFNPADLPSQKFLEKHIPKLAGDIADTTKERVTNTIKQGLVAGKNRDELADDLKGIFDDPKRRETIAHTESVTAFSEGRIQAGIQMGADTKEWSAQVVRCPLCDALHGKTAPLTGTFDDGTFAPPRHPNCVLAGQEVIALGVTSKFVADYDGPIVHITTEKGTNLSVTPNHLVLTRRGWVKAAELQHGDDLISTTLDFEQMALVDPDVQAIKSLIEEVSVPDGVVFGPVPASPEDLHGDGVFCEDIDIVRANSSLRADREAAISEHVNHHPLVGTLVSQGALNSPSAVDEGAEALMSTANGSVSSLGVSPVLFGSSAGNMQTVGIADTAYLDALALDESGDCVPAHTKLVGELLDRDTGLVSLDKVVGIRRDERFHGKVYDLETRGHWYSCNTIVTHNCLCSVKLVFAGGLTPDPEAIAKRQKEYDTYLKDRY